MKLPIGIAVRSLGCKGANFLVLVEIRHYPALFRQLRHRTDKSAATPPRTRSDCIESLVGGVVLLAVGAALHIITVQERDFTLSADSFQYELVNTAIKAVRSSIVQIGNCAVIMRLQLLLTAQ